jgi:hypothetical protein
MKNLMLLPLLFFANIIYGQSFHYPVVKQQGKTVNDFVPAGWTVLASAKGDLNKDNVPDAAVILQHKDSVNFVEEWRSGNTLTVVTQPRILIILFKSPADNQFHLAEQNNDCVMLHDSPTREEPFQEMTIDKGILKLDYQIFCNAGCWEITNLSYKFRYQANEFTLIGADYDSMHRASHASQNYSFNFLTKKRTKNISANDDDKGHGDTQPIHITALKTLKTLKSVFSWEVEKDFYL